MGGGGSTYDYGFRIYNPGLGKFLSVDPISKEYPWYSSYHFAGNMPVWAIDIDGLEPEVQGNRIVGYNVQSGQGPTQLAADINNPNTMKEYGYVITKPISWIEIIDNPKNSKWFNHVKENRYDEFNEQYKSLRYSTGEYLHITGTEERTILPNSKLKVDLKDDNNLLIQTLSLMKLYSLENKISGGEFLEDGKYGLSEFLKNTEKFSTNNRLDIGIGADFPGLENISRTIDYEEGPVKFIFSLQEGNKLTLTNSDERWGQKKLVTYGFSYPSITGGKSVNTRLIQVDFGENKNLYQTAKKAVNGKVPMDDLKNEEK